MTNTRYVSLFCGAGGFDAAAERVGGFDCVMSSEIDEAASEAYRLNFPNHNLVGDITKINEADVPAHDLLIAGFPCQAFSVAGNRLGFKDPRGTLFFDVLRIAKHRQPSTLLLENVVGLLNHDNGNTYRTIIHELNKIGYKTKTKVLNAKNFGVAQNRRRIFIVARQDVSDFRWPSGNLPSVSVADVLLDEQDVHERYYSKRKFHRKNANQLTMFEEPPTAKYHGIVRLGYVGDTGYHQTSTVHDIRGIAPTQCAGPGSPGFMTGLYLVRGKIRALTPRESARLQGFDDSHIFHGTLADKQKQAGNAVCVNVAEATLRRLNHDKAGK